MMTYNEFAGYRETIESLRQQLDAVTKERDKAKAMPMRYRRMEFNAQLQDENEALRQQLADHIKREVMLRDVVSHVGGMRFSIVTTKMCEAALAATEPKEQGK